MPRLIPFCTDSLDADQQSQVSRALEQFHGAQQAVRLETCTAPALPLAGERVDVTAFFSSSASAPCVVVTGRGLSDNWFTHAEQGRGLVTVSDWQVAFLTETGGAPTSAPDANILTSLALTTLLTIAGCNDDSIIHERTTGCLFDLCAHKPDRALKMRAAYVCGACASALANRGVSSVELDAIHAVLDRVRQLILGRQPQSTLPISVATDDSDFVASATPPAGIDLPPRLVEACAESSVTVLVGSGMSLQTDVQVTYPAKLGWTTLPSWSEVPGRMSESVRRYTGRVADPRATQSLEEFLADLDYFRRALGETVYYPRAIFDIFSPHVASPGRANRLLFRLPLKWLLTTNYDFVLQYAAPAGTPVYTWREARAAREYLAAGGARRPILKVHGCASRPDTVVLTGLEYERLSQHEEYLSLLRSVFDSHTILFVGFGLSDPFDLDLVLRQARLAGAAEGEKFALLHQDRCAHVREKFPQVHTIPCADHASIARILATLIRASTSGSGAG